MEELQRVRRHLPICPSTAPRQRIQQRTRTLRFCHPSLTSTAPSQTPCIQQQKRQRMEQMKKLGIGKFENQVGTPLPHPHAPSASTHSCGHPRERSFPRSPRALTHRPPPFPVLTRRRIRTTTTPRAPDPRTTTPARASQTTRGAPQTDGSKLRRRAQSSETSSSRPRRPSPTPGTQTDASRQTDDTAHTKRSTWPSRHPAAGPWNSSSTSRTAAGITTRRCSTRGEHRT